MEVLEWYLPIVDIFPSWMAFRGRRIVKIGVSSGLIPMFGRMSVGDMPYSYGA